MTLMLHIVKEISQETLACSAAVAAGIMQLAPYSARMLGCQLVGPLHDWTMDHF